MRGSCGGEVGRDHQGGICADRFGVLHQFDRLGRRIRASAGDHRHTAASGLNAKFNHPAVFIVTQGSGLAGGADGNEAVDAAGDLALDQGHEGAFVDLAIAERRDERRHDATKEGFGHVRIRFREKTKSRDDAAW